MKRAAKGVASICALAFFLAGCKPPLDSVLLDKTKDSLLGPATLALSLGETAIENGAEGVVLAASQAGGSSDTEFTLRNSGGRPLTISAASITFTEGAASFSTATVFPLTLAPGESRPFVLAFAPGTDRSASVNVGFSTNDPVSGTFRFSALGRLAQIASAPLETWKGEAIAGCMPGHDGIGRRANFRGPSDITAIGTILYVTDGYTIRSIDTVTMAVTTIAGADQGSSSVDGRASAARFKFPSSITSDGSRLYIAEGTSVRMLDLATMEVTTIAGNSALFGGRIALCCDADCIYVLDYYNCTVRAIDKDTYAVTTIAGAVGQSGTTDGDGSAARFNASADIESVGDYLYVADKYALRRISKAAPHTVLTVAGSGTVSGHVNATGTAARFSTLNALSAVNGSLYASDGSEVRRIALPGFEVATVAGDHDCGYVDGAAASARFYAIEGYAQVGSIVYMADGGNNAVRSLDTAAAMVSTAAGTPDSLQYADGFDGQARFYYPTGVALRGNDFYFADSTNHAIRKLDLATGEVVTLAGLGGASGSQNGTGSSARFNSPTGLHLDGDALYVADKGNDTVRKVSLSDYSVSTIAGAAGQGGAVDAIGASARFTSLKGLAGDAGFLYATDENTIRAIDKATYQVTTLAGLCHATTYLEGVGTASRWRVPMGIVVSGRKLFICDSDNLRVRSLDLDTLESALVAGMGTPGQVDGLAAGFGCTYFWSGPRELALIGESLYVSDYANTIRKVDIPSGYTTTIAGTNNGSGIMDGIAGSIRFTQPSGIIALPDGRLIVVASRTIHMLTRIQ